ncbi:ABC transporter ATP-binding protein [Thermodesulfovibrio sp. 3907-1M]|uniref:ABC transporter ATP-binding protein n=1 Tax=Thermodesulfovibrio autotrophicus TaxID=3118333 RepID=A0AAU8GZY9_9BACT
MNLENPSMKEILRTKNLKKTYWTKAGSIEVLKGIDFTAYQGEIVAITGASGVGKSTFLHVIGTLDKPTSGDILFKFQEEINPLKLSADSLAEFRNKHIGFVFQFHYLLPEFNVLENVIMPELIASHYSKTKLTQNVIKERAFEILKKLGLSERAQHRPGELSGGEQQRVAVARALFKNPSLVLADEPTGNLDSRSAHELFELFKKINSEEGITFIIVTHNEAIAQKCTRTLRMIDGVLT